MSASVTSQMRQLVAQPLSRPFSLDAVLHELVDRPPLKKFDIARNYLESPSARSEIGVVVTPLADCTAVVFLERYPAVVGRQVYHSFALYAAGNPTPLGRVIFNPIDEIPPTNMALWWTLVEAAIKKESIWLSMRSMTTTEYFFDLCWRERATGSRHDVTMRGWRYVETWRIAGPPLP
ncbi:hypothetical protein EXIGLDRAFT_698097 [Exidia glandulosa HHB12029]|uniref:Uncharacterized protein n=1 Tax=Exidia glandulosa HHB12029 TaxID=1314781 RepID=A0A165EGJ5_EXIGL|nr:hypothetical protein EXIGLDRAFT_698097 [Exidia glandulosa HHB12029]